jgi:2,3-bisphosphoglycerate-dependent phosphoglycerate mutase
VAEQEQGLDLRVLHTSVLTRAVRTANLALDELGRSWIPVRRHWRLNERHYGALQGKNKIETTAEFGIDQVKVWRRSYSTRPPAIADKFHPVHDPRYRGVPRAALPASECLADVVTRMIPYWEDVIVPDLHALGGVLVVAHGNSLRALVKYLTDMSDEDVVGLEIPTGVPWLFRLGPDLSVTEQRLLGDPEAIKEAIEATAHQAG